MSVLKQLVPWLCLLLLLGCSAASSKKQKAEIILPPGTLNKAELSELFSGKSVESETGSGRISLTYYDPSGTLRQLQYGEKRDGKWRIRDDARICLKLGDDDEQCRIVVKENGVYKKYVVKTNNRHRHVITYRSFRPGNLVDM